MSRNCCTLEILRPLMDIPYTYRTSPHTHTQPHTQEVSLWRGREGGRPDQGPHSEGGNEAEAGRDTRVNGALGPGRVMERLEPWAAHAGVQGHSCHYVHPRRGTGITCLPDLWGGSRLPLHAGLSASPLLHQESCDTMCLPLLGCAAYPAHPAAACT